MIDKLYKIVKIVIGIFLAIFLGNKLFSCINVYAETLEDTTPWTIIRYQNSSGTTLVTYNCPNPNAYSNDYCTYSFLYPDTPSNYQFELGFRFTTQPFVFKANTDYKIIIYATGIVDYSKIKISHELSSGAYSTYVSPKNISISGNKITMTLSYSSNVSAKTIILKIPLITNGSAGERVSMGISRNFTIYDVDDSGSVIIDQNETIIEQNKETNEKLDQTNDNLNDLKEQEKETYDYLTDESEPNSDISSLGNVQGLLPPGPVDSLLNIPFKFLSVVNSSFGGVCNPLEGPFVYDSTLTLPCFSEVFYDEVPPLLLNFISLIPAAWILISYFKHLYKKVNRAVSMETNADDEWGVL